MIGGDGLAPQFERPGFGERGAKSDAERDSARTLAETKGRDERSVAMNIIAGTARRQARVIDRHDRTYWIVALS